MRDDESKPAFPVVSDHQDRSELRLIPPVNADIAPSHQDVADHGEPPVLSEHEILSYPAATANSPSQAVTLEVVQQNSQIRRLPSVIDSTFREVASSSQSIDLTKTNSTNNSPTKTIVNPYLRGSITKRATPTLAIRPTPAKRPTAAKQPTPAPRPESIFLFSVRPFPTSKHEKPSVTARSVSPFQLQTTSGPTSTTSGVSNKYPVSERVDSHPLSSSLPLLAASGRIETDGRLDAKSAKPAYRSDDADVAGEDFSWIW